MTSPDEKVETLVAWARKNLPGLRHEPSAIVADRLGDEVLGVDGQLGVEVADDSPSAREIIVTAFSEPRLFETVRRIVDSLSGIRGWRFVALKPPRGFAFALSIGESRVEAKDLAFRPIPEIEAGIQLVTPPMVPAPSGEEAEELAWLVAETGLGEELAGLLQHVEFSNAEATEERHPIGELEAYVRANWEKPGR